jgi:hypothetical protein
MRIILTVSFLLLSTIILSWINLYPRLAWSNFRKNVMFAMQCELISDKFIPKRGETWYSEYQCKEN